MVTWRLSAEIAEQFDPPTNTVASGHALLWLSNVFLCIETREFAKNLKRFKIV